MKQGCTGQLCSAILVKKSKIKSLCTNCLIHVFFSYSRNTTLNLSVYSFDQFLEYFVQKTGSLPIKVWKKLSDWPFRRGFRPPIFSIDNLSCHFWNETKTFGQKTKKVRVKLWFSLETKGNFPNNDCFSKMKSGHVRGNFGNPNGKLSQKSETLLFPVQIFKTERPSQNSNTQHLEANLDNSVNKI